MKIVIFTTFAGIALVIAGCASTANNPSQAPSGAASGQAVSAPLTSKEAVRQMGRGVNLGNTLEPPTEGGWNNGPAQECYFDDFKAAGFTCVRIPVCWDKHTATNAPYTVDEAWMNRVGQVVDWGLARGFFIVIDAHHEDWLKTHYADPARLRRFEQIWVQIANRFKDKSGHLIFEILNEPHGMTTPQVNDLNARILKIIRATNPTRLVLFTGNDWSQVDRFILTAAPKDPYVIGTFHYYLPDSFANKGKGTWGSEQDRAFLEHEFDKVSAWSRTNQIPVFLGEFATVGTCDPASRRAYYAAVVSEALRRDFAFAVWDNGGDCRLYDRTNRSWSELKDIVIHTPAKP
jgi:aryl-phospho-beta-D-glucosidase BglC (GH1 family)